MIAGSSEHQTLEGKEIVGLTFDEVVKTLTEIGLNEFEEDRLEKTDKILKFDSKSLNIWFDEGMATEIQWSPL